MQDFSQKERIPTIGINNFTEGQPQGSSDVLFHELLGERHIDTPHMHDFFMIILFDHASGVHHIDAIDYPVGNKEIHILFPQQMHTWHIHDGSIGYQLMVQRAFFERFAPYFRFSFANYQNHPVIQLSDSAYDLLHYEFNAIKNELKVTDTLAELISARAAVIAAVVSKEAERIFEEYKIYQSNPRLADFNMIIDKFYKTERFVSYYANALHVSPNYLNILCKKHLKLSATQLIQRRVILEAKRLLQNSNLSIKYVALELGFSDHAHFSNFFKTQTGVTPTIFRKKE
ncbi:AraC family transcriptional regulator [Sphingobacterium sp. DN00404]|uniref:AraC family transcriptional regulator n=1 Tax=Sphingobacterium micropteri TaxID=2763501 RepID=A0ABR7YJR0_9SPHI|nr:helix-turn-helix domain-containing protein [Sphingobacterium micropteri]MBD1431564.1 AraC family transcriptional regulator [Sphingobacterium micropteri]